MKNPLRLINGSRDGELTIGPTIDMIMTYGSTVYTCYIFCSRPIYQEHDSDTFTGMTAQSLVGNIHVTLPQLDNLLRST